MWAALADNPFAPQRAGSAVTSPPSAIAPLPLVSQTAPVSTFRFNFGGGDNGSNDSNSTSHENVDMGGGEMDSSVNTSTLIVPATFTRPARKHLYTDGSVPRSQLQLNDVEVVTLFQNATFIVEPLKQVMKTGGAAAGQQPVARFYKHRARSSETDSATAAAAPSNAAAASTFLPSSSSSISSSTSLSSILSVSDLQPRIYEGGFKIWECAIDLILYMAKNLPQMQAPSPAPSSLLFPHGFTNLRITELGCGHGFPGLFTLLYGARYVSLQDYNSEVIDEATLENVKMNCGGVSAEQEQDSDNGAENASPNARIPSSGAASSMMDLDAFRPTATFTLPALHAAAASSSSSSSSQTNDLLSRCESFSGDWSDPALFSLMTQTQTTSATAPPTAVTGLYDLVLTSDTLYSSDYFLPLFTLITRLLSPQGIALIAAKRYYFGIGGSTLEFMDLVKVRGKGEWECDVVETVEDGKSNIREILLLRRKRG